MSKFCTKCGAACDDSTAFCTSCGAKFDAASQQPAAAKPAAAAAASGEEKSILEKFKENANMDTIKGLKDRPDFTKIVGIAVVAVAALIVLIIIISLAGSGWKKPVNNFFKGIEDNDPDTFMKSYCEVQLDYLEDYYKDMDSKIDDVFEKRLDRAMDTLKDELGKDIKISFKITDKDKLSDKKLDDYKDEIKKLYDAKGIDVSAGYELEIEYTIEGKKDEDEDDGEMIVLKVDGEWCVYGWEFDGVLGKAI